MFLILAAPIQGRKSVGGLLNEMRDVKVRVDIRIIGRINED